MRDYTNPTPLNIGGDSYWRWADCAGLVRIEDEVIGGIGAATPAVCEPKPNFCRVGASSFPDGLSPWPDWNFLIASTVESSHLPFGVPANEPSLASACWISEMRSGAGAFCPGSRRLECLLDFFKRDLLAAEAAGLAELRVALPVGLPAAFPGAFAGADGADQAAPAVRSSARPAVIDVRSLIEASTICIATVFVAAPIYIAKAAIRQ